MLGLTMQELSQYAAPLLLGVILLGSTVQQFIRGQKLQQHRVDGQAAVHEARQHLHEQDID